MKKLFTIAIILVLVSSLLVGCTPKAEEFDIEKLVVLFVPSRNPESITNATGPLKKLLKDELAKHDINVGEVDIQVGSSYEAVGDALSAGSAHVGFIPGGTYVLYDEDVDVILTATRAGLNKDSENAKDWNDGKPTEGIDEQVTYYRSLFIVGPSEKGQALLKKVNDGEAITAEELKELSWALSNSSSSSGYIYPAAYLYNNYDLKVSDIPNKVQIKSYGDKLGRLASGQVDVVTAYADARRDYIKEWTSDFGREKSIWEETGIIAVTEKVYNDTVSVSKTNEEVTPELITALQEAFQNIVKDEEGAKVLKIYSHSGYKVAKSEDYDSHRQAQEFVKSIK
ncbi:PhnD/SsuA/transferrin family substrate-binding protein [Clostridium sp. 'deep sea']|uniref:phosphate/phosphite/phosphonate ABC transporter substrate-binding protein n=1 Tax=Clostridium sp. 'deep sea' TaxID=2779445 RepID=UPI00189680E8|nr:PhnD/SsuA/transferrin family substrate-binding protein [Clostridium sp. 'deep sea']QOR34391.1 PhnD/SsuA/transferrin family substrate-binding protein [Clostridium sp. 'deep sea']